MSIKISKGNKKLGNIPSFSLPSGLTCSESACKTCYQEGCYARRLEQIYPSVKSTYRNNYDFVVTDLQRFTKEMSAYFQAPNAPRFFRIHVSGDFFSVEYAMAWFEIIKHSQNTHFLAFTKQWDILRAVPFDTLSNACIRLSAWTDCKVPEDLAKTYRTSYVDCGQNFDFSNAFRCNGDCSQCVACWGSQFDTVFNKH